MYFEWLQCVNVGSSVVTDTTLVGDVDRGWGESLPGLYRKSLYLPCSFAVNLKYYCKKIVLINRKSRKDSHMQRHMCLLVIMIPNKDFFFSVESFSCWLPVELLSATVIERTVFNSYLLAAVSVPQNYFVGH